MQKKTCTVDMTDSCLTHVPQGDRLARDSRHNESACGYACRYVATGHALKVGPLGSGLRCRSCSLLSIPHKQLTATGLICNMPCLKSLATADRGTLEVWHLAGNAGQNVLFLHAIAFHVALYEPVVGARLWLTSWENHLNSAGCFCTGIGACCILLMLWSPTPRSVNYADISSRLDRYVCQRPAVCHGSARSER